MMSRRSDFHQHIGAMLDVDFHDEQNKDPRAND